MPETFSHKAKQAFLAVPPEVKKFVIKGVTLLVGWCLLYGLLLKPYNLIDPVLTKYTGSATMWLVQYFYKDIHPSAVYSLHSVFIYLNNKEVLSIWDACNGLDLYVLLAGFIICVPMGAKKMSLFILTGIASIFILNVIRCLALASLFYHHSEYSNIAHHYFFQLIVYAAIFMVWERYLRSYKGNYEPAKV